MKKRNRNIAINIAVVISFFTAFAGCTDGIDDADLGKKELSLIRLSICDPEKVEVRGSSVDKPEQLILNAYLLVFDGTTGVYKYGDSIPVANILYNGRQRPEFSTSLNLVAGDRLLVLLNTGNSVSSDVLNARMSGQKLLPNIISRVFPLNNCTSCNPTGEGLPMSGEVIVKSDGVPVIPVYRAVAKFSVVLASQLLDLEDSCKFGLFSAAQVGYIYARDSGVIEKTGFGSFSKPNESEFLPVPVNGTLSEKSFYSAEYESSVLAAGTDISDTQFIKTRICVIVKMQSKNKGTMYYRLDFYRDNKFIDIHRNTHYTFTISKILSAGYSTCEEALQAPGSNLEYTVTVTDRQWQATISNGQYAVHTSKDSVVVRKGVSQAAALVKFGVQLPDGQAENILDEMKTHSVSLVGGDGKTISPDKGLKLCKSDGTDVPGNIFSFQEIPTEGYQLMYTSSSDALPAEPISLLIEFGNIRHVIPVILE